VRLGRPEAARQALSRALELVPPGPEERLLRQRLAALE